MLLNWQPSEANTAASDPQVTYMTEAEKEEFERRLVMLRDIALAHAKATAHTVAESDQAERAYLKSEAELRDFVLQRSREER